MDDIHFEEYQEKPDVVATAPGRFHIIGEHCWFFKDKTLSTAVNLPVYVSVSKRKDSSLKFYYYQLDDRKHSSISTIKYKKEDKWANVIKSVLYGFISGGFDVAGMNITVYSEIQSSAGFGITTAIKAAVLTAVCELFKLPCTEVQKLQVLERANRKFLQQGNFLSENYTVMFSKKDNFVITDYAKNTWEYIPYQFEGKKIFLIDTKVPSVYIWKEDSLFEPQYALLLGDLKDRKPNVYGGWQYISNPNDINEELSEVSEDVSRKLKCIMREHKDVLDAKVGLETRDFFKFARAVNHSHESLRDMYSSSCPEVDWILKRVGELEPNLEMVSNPVTCGRITGKGFGRSLFVIIRDSDEEVFRSKLVEFEKIFGYHPDCYCVSPADGAHLVTN